MRRFLRKLTLIVLGLLAGAVACFTLVQSAHAFGVSASQFFKRVGNAIVPTNAAWTIGSPSNRVAGIYTDVVDASNLGFNGAVAGDLSVTGDAEISGHTSTTWLNVNGQTDLNGNVTLGANGYSSQAYGNFYVPYHNSDQTMIGGSIFYNTSTNKFRCYEIGGWKDCVSGGGVGWNQGSGYIYQTDTNDNVVIGDNASSSEKLHIVSNNPGNAVMSVRNMSMGGPSSISFQDSGGYPRSGIGYNGPGGFGNASWVGTYNNDSFIIGASSTPIAYFRLNERGDGTSEPSVHIGDNPNSGGSLLSLQTHGENTMIELLNTSSTQGSFMEFRDENDHGAGVIGFAGSQFPYGGVTSTLLFGTIDNYDVAFFSGEQPRLFLTRDGYVKVLARLVIGANGTPITDHRSATSSLDFESITGNDCDDLTMTVTSSTDGDTVNLGVPTALASIAGLSFTGFVSAPNTVTVRACNSISAPSVDPAPADVRADVWKH